MAVILTDHRITISEADTDTGWTGNTDVFTSDPVPVEATACLGQAVSIDTADGYYTSTARNISNDLVYVWVLPNGTMDTVSLGGVSVYVGDGTNNIAFHKAGSDAAGFRSEAGLVGWQCLTVDGANLPSTAGTFTARSGSLGSLNTSSITRFGATFKTLSKALGGAANCFIDIIRLSDLSTNDACVLTITGGTSGDPGEFLEVAVEDRSNTNLKAHGVIRELGTGVYGCQGPIRFGESTGTSSSWFEDYNGTFVFENRGFSTSRYRIVVRDNGTGTTTVKFGNKVGTGVDATGSDGYSFVAPTGVGALWDSATDTNVTDVFIYGTSFTGFTNGISFRDPQEFINCTFSAGGQINPNGAIMVNSNVVNSTASSALLWNVNSDIDGKLDGSSFSSSGTGHAIEFGSNTPSEITMRNLSFSGYGADSTSNAVVYNNSGKALTINVIGGDVPTVLNGTGASTTFVPEPRTFTLTGLQTDSEVKIIRISDDVILTETENSTTSFSYLHSGGDIPVRVIVFHLYYLPVRFETTLANADQSIPVFQIFDRQYDNPE